MIRKIGEASHTPQELHKLLIEHKVSYRWLQSLEKSIELSTGHVQSVTVCDREADIYGMFVRGYERQPSLLDTSQRKSEPTRRRS